MVLGIGSLESAEIYQRCLRQIFNIQTYFNERLYRKTYQWSIKPFIGIHPNLPNKGESFLDTYICISSMLQVLSKTCLPQCFLFVHLEYLINHCSQKLNNLQDYKSFQNLIFHVVYISNYYFVTDFPCFDKYYSQVSFWKENSKCSLLFFFLGMQRLHFPVSTAISWVLCDWVSGMWGEMMCCIKSNTIRSIVLCPHALFPVRVIENEGSWDGRVANEVSWTLNGVKLENYARISLV